MAGRRGPASWRVALSLFTTLPSGAGEALDEEAAARAVLWLPGIGLLLGGAGGGIMLAVGRLNHTGPGRLLGAALAVAALAVLTGGLHLDGLADTADGLGSRRPAQAALEIMRRSDIGPMGVGALVLTLLIQVTALAAIGGPLAAAALVLGEVTGRVSVVVATAVPAARPGGFGALVAGRTTPAERALTACALGCGAAAAGLTAGGPALAGRWLAAALGGLLAGLLVQRTARRRLGGMTGDVFGAVLQASAVTVALVAALAWLSSRRPRPRRRSAGACCSSARC